MRNVLILCLFAFCFASAAKKSIAVFPCKGDYDAKALLFLREKLEGVIIDVLPDKDYFVMPYNEVHKNLSNALGGSDKADEALYNATCSADGACYLKLMEQAEVDYGAWCTVNNYGGKWKLTFYMYKTIEKEATCNKEYGNYNPQNVDDLAKIIKDEVPESIKEKFFGVYEVIPAYRNKIGEKEKWKLYINNNAKDSYKNSLYPGNYNVRLSHNCYEAINSSVEIDKGKTEIFDMANSIRLKTSELVLNAVRNDKPVNEFVFVNGNQRGKTPFRDSVPLCADIRIGEKREKVEVTLLYNEKVELTHKMSLVQKTSTFVAIGLDVLGAAALGFAVYENSKTQSAFDRYSVRGRDSDYYEDAWKDAESSRNTRNVFYVIGGVLLASGIGVHIWF